MAKAKTKRDNVYYLRRLELENPAVYADYRAGKFRTVADALVAGGLRRSRSSLDVLEVAWKKASTAERLAFLKAIGHPFPAASPASTVATPAMPVSSTPIHVDRYLTKDARAAIQDVMDKHRLKMGGVMHELGFKRRNPALGLALNQGRRLKDDLLEKLQPWLEKHGWM